MGEALSLEKGLNLRVVGGNIVGRVPGKHKQRQLEIVCHDGILVAWGAVAVAVEGLWAKSRDPI